MSPLHQAQLPAKSGRSMAANCQCSGVIEGRRESDGVRANLDHSGIHLRAGLACIQRVLTNLLLTGNRSLYTLSLYREPRGGATKIGKKPSRNRLKELNDAWMVETTVTCPTVQERGRE